MTSPMGSGSPETDERKDTLMPIQFSNVGYSYRARLQRRESVPGSDGKTHNVSHSMTMAGRVHPKPYNHTTAVEVAQIQLRRLADLGWYVVSLIVTGYDEQDA